MAKRKKRKKPEQAQEPVVEWKHCDDFIEDPNAHPALRAFLEVARAPAHGVFERAKGNDPQLFADFEGKRVKVVMASRFGDVGITYDLTAECGYKTRVPVEMLSNFGDKP